MVKIKFFHQDNIFTGIECSGHSGYSHRGSDIICSGVSALMNALVLGLEDIAAITIDRSSALMRVVWPVNESQRLSLLTETIMRSLEMIAHENPRYVKIISEVN
ncbi:MAG: ribosomal-processing cysteine protease Prp [Synergistaceae bacterium]|nr:ribosomal-processing cysteine protease Prp [Synergistaceae bacterium]MBR0203075.1 ribosomal-processing cysteine protease Prp [Synergistaceae bacterium]